MKTSKYNTIAAAAMFMAASVVGYGAIPDSTTTVAPQQLVQNVRHALNTLAYYGVFDDLSFSVEGNTVTLMGEVMQPVTRNSAVSAVKHLEGVGLVVDKIEVLPLSPYDNRLRLNAYNAIYGYPTLSRYAMQSRPPIRILVKNGTVTLAGVVNNDMDRKLAYNRVAGLPGAFQVSNQLRLDSDNAAN